MRLWGLWLFFHIENMHIIIHYDHTCTLKFLYRWLFMYNPQIEMFARFKMKSSFHKTKRII